MQKLTLIRRIAFPAGVFTLLLGIAVALWAVDRFRDAEYDAFRDQSIELAFVLADSAGSWIVRDNMDALGFACDVLLAGSARYVRIVIQGTTILDRRIDQGAESMRDPHVFPELGEASYPLSKLEATTLHVAVPIEWAGGRGDPIGSVQIGFDDHYAREQVCSYRRLAFGLVAGVLLSLLLLGTLSIRHLKRSARWRVIRTDGMMQAGPSDTIRCGSLAIDGDTCRVQLYHQDIRLTPKMFDLLSYLARHPGKIFSDSDLLAALWADAPYATSSDVKQCVYVLRQRLGVAHPNPKAVVVNVKGFGYKLEPPIERTLIEK